MKKLKVNKKDFQRLKSFLLETKDLQKEELGKELNIIDFDSDDTFVSNTNQTEDIWLYNRIGSNLEFIKNQIIKEYKNNNFIFCFKIDIFAPKSAMISRIKHASNTIFLYRKEDRLFHHDEILVYGTTDFIIFLENCYLQLCGKNILKNIEINFFYSGVNITYKKGEFFVEDKKIDLKLSYDDFFIPKINYSFDYSEAKNYNSEEVFISGNDIYHDVSMYQNSDMKNLKLYCLGSVPLAITNLIL